MEASNDLLKKHLGEFRLYSVVMATATQKLLRKVLTEAVAVAPNDPRLHSCMRFPAPAYVDVLKKVPTLIGIGRVV